MDSLAEKLSTPGLTDFLSARSPQAKWFWAACLLAGTVFTLYEVGRVVEDYHTRPYVTVMDFKENNRYSVNNTATLWPQTIPLEGTQHSITYVCSARRRRTKK